MKYHQFSQAISSLTHITGKHELVIVESGTPYIVDNILLNDMKQVVVHAYSLEYIKNNSGSTEIVPIQCNTLAEFQRQYVDTPQSFIPLGSTFNKDLPDIIIYLDEKGFVNPEYKIRPMTVLDPTIKYAPVCICSESSPIASGILQMDSKLKELEKEFKNLEKKVQDENKGKYRIEVIRYVLSSALDYAVDSRMDNPNNQKGFTIDDYRPSCFNTGYSFGTSLSMAYFSTLCETYYVEKWDAADGVLGLFFADGKIKCIPMNTIKEFNIEEKNGGVL